MAHDIPRPPLRPSLRERWPQLRRARAASWTASAVCAVGFLLWARTQRLPQPPRSLAQGLALAAALAAYGLATLGLCERWSFLLKRHAPGLVRTVTYRPAPLGQLGNVFLPARVGDALRVGFAPAAYEPITATTAVGILIAERALDIGCHALLLATVLIVTFGPPFTLSPAVAIAAGLGAALASAGCLLALRRVRLHGLEGRRPRTRALSQFAGALLEPLTGLRDGGSEAVLLSLLMWAGEVLGWWAAARAVGLELSVPQAAYVFAVASLALILPVGFGSIGTLDAGIVFALKTIGAGGGAVLGFVVLLRALSVLPSFAMVLGLFSAARLRRSPPRAAQAVDRPAAPRRSAATRGRERRD